MAAAAAQVEHPHVNGQETLPMSPQSTKPLAHGEVACPDPAAHGRDKRLQEQASTAALYVTNPERASNLQRNDHLSPDGKLSSASAAASLKYARAQDLPSFPVVGIDTANSAGSAALLAAGNHTKIELWKPDGISDNAAKAALLAKDYKMAPLWQPELSAAGSKAALLAHKDGAKLDLWFPEASADGNSAAGIAMRNKTLSPQVDYGYTDTGKKNALTAATGAVAARNRKRAESSPAPLPNYPDAANSAHNSLNAATVAHKPSVKRAEDANRLNSEAMESARITHIGANVPKEMFGAAPPVSIEVEEQRRNAALRASAISMAKKMYDTQQNAINEAAGNSNIGETAARGASARPVSMASITTTTSTADLKTQALQYMKVQEQAQKLAAERLSKLEPDGATAFRNYYGYSNTPPRSRLSVRRGRRRASSEGEMVDSDDEEQSRRIRNQMSVFNTKLAQVDAKKRQKDRENLLAAAERKVHAQMHSMDERVFMETGKVPSAMMEEWEARARAKAAEQSEKRLENHGKVHVGGGRFLDQSEIDAVAASRVAPTLNEISEAAEAQRARDEERRLDEEEKKRLAAVEKERETERKAEEKRMKSEMKAEEKARKSKEKAAAKAGKEMEKARRAIDPTDESNQTRRVVTAPAATSIGTSDAAHGQSCNQFSSNGRKKSVKDMSFSAPTSPIDSSTSSKEGSGSRGLKSFFSRLKRRSHIGRSKEGRDSDEASPHSNRSSFIGGAALRSQASLATPREQLEQRPSTSSPSAIRTTPMSVETGRRSSPSISSLESSEVARTTSRGGFASSWSSRGRQRSAATGVSSVSNEDDADDEFVDARETDGDALQPPPRVGSAMAKRSTESPQRDSRFME
ncbi:hypothetical protein B0J12DRAFT_615910, partial [Macrophomina phaseolina]